MSPACKSKSLGLKLNLRLLVWKEDAACFDGGKLFSDRLKSVLATKCHLNHFLEAATYLDEAIVTQF